MESLASSKSQYALFIGASLLIFLCVVILYAADAQLFQRFIGKINPPVAAAAIIIVGFGLLSLLLTRQWFAIYNRDHHPRALLMAAGLAAVLGVVVILADTQIVFPADTNVAFPHSVLFYPAIAFLVEILFHLLPLTALLLVLNALFKPRDIGSLVLVCIIIVAVLEPIYHVQDMATADRYPTWAIAFVGSHVFLINFIQLHLFRRYDFVTMYAFRLVYYAFWHIGWGYFRLELLF